MHTFKYLKSVQYTCTSAVQVVNKEMNEEDISDMILENAHVLTCFNCGELLEQKATSVNNNTTVAVLHIDPGELNYPHEPDVPASVYFECMECHERNWQDVTEITELRTAIVQYKAQEEQLIDMIQRINEITEEKETRD